MTDKDHIAARIFLSYHKRNAALAKAIVESLRTEIDARWGEGPRVSVWFDAAISAGDNWDPKIQVELELADIILFLVTPACLEAGFMWTDEFPIALDRFRSGEGRVRLVPLLYSDTLAPIRTHRYTRGLNFLPDKPHDQMADGWTDAVSQGVCRLIEGVLLQRDPPMMKLKPALESAQNALLAAQAMFGGVSADGFFGPLLASEINNVLGAIEAALGLTARERLRALSVWEPKLKTALVRLKQALPDHSRSLRDLRDAIDDVTTYSNEETTSQLPVHQSDPIRFGARDAVRDVREEVGAARQVLADLESAPRAENPIERDARALTVDLGNRHATLAEALLDEPQIDAAALSDEITGVDHVAQNFADTIGRLGAGASPAGQAHSASLSASAARAVRLTERLIAEGAAARTSSHPSEVRKPVSPPEATPAPAGERSAPYKIPLELLELSPPRDAAGDAQTLGAQARRLEGWLADMGVQGEVVSARPGPVVTLFEFEPASGVKSSRVIALSDDMARQMNAPAARVAVIPGRNAIGIELPSSVRQLFRLRDALSSAVFAGTQGDLPLALGETIEGDPFAADLTKMPHLLIAGTTGSGKSVGINAMILSLLYKHSPDECRFIMIDPKMLELSVYEGIPHLLHPVVTDPKKAVVALKWTVREMEDRYRRMVKLGVRNITGYNERVADALERGEKLERTVHAGFDPSSGEPIYETRELPLEPMPYIVVVIDEMADLMITAGEEVEACVQRLSQMARAAGIHVITASQRPTPAVITGTIKANFATRMSYTLTSKTDSRTILGEQGAEHLLGQGDLLFMTGGGRIRRLHGALVSDLEVERVVEWLKNFGPPHYRADVTDPSDFGSDGAELFDDDASDLLERAIALVRRDGKASTSYLQQRLQIGYNRAATLIEKMEKAGIISEASTEKREVLPPDEEE